jgi:hypothetical protein
MSGVLLLRRSIGLVIAGLAVQLGASLYWSPITFIAFAAVGFPLVLIGVVGCIIGIRRAAGERS